jgi:hypothetical protein
MSFRFEILARDGKARAERMFTPPGRKNPTPAKEAGMGKQAT